MSQAVITKAFTQWKAQQAVDNKAVTLDEFIFANVPGLDVTKPISNTEGIPAADKIVYRQTVGKTGVVNTNAVVYSVTLGADVGDFDFNWIGLINKASGTLAMIIHAPTQRKVKNASGQQGNVLVRSMLMEYSGAQTATSITTPAETWQIDFTARLAGMDEADRLNALDIYGAGAFFDNGFLVAKTGTQYFVTKGLGYVGGLRAALAANQNVAVSTKPTKVWADVSYQGTLTSAFKTDIKFTVAATLADYTTNGIAHYVFALASIDANGVITDLRPKGSSQYLRRDKNLTDISDPEKALNTLNGVPKTRTVNKKALNDDITLTATDVGAMSSLMLGTDITKIKRLDDPSIINVTNPISISATYEDHPLGASYVVAGQLHNWRRFWDAGSAAYQRLINNDGQVFERMGSYTAAAGWKWLLGDSAYPFGWRKVFDSGSMTLADLTRLGVAQAGNNADITSMSKLTSIALEMKMARTLEVASSIQSNYRIGVLRANEYEAYMSLTSRVGVVSDESLPASAASMGNIFFRVQKTLDNVDPHAGRALGGVTAAIYPSGEGITRLDARDENGAIRSRIVCDGLNDMVQIANGYLRPDGGINLNASNAESVIRGKNNAIILRDHNNGNVTLSASLKDAGSGIGGTLYIGYNTLAGYHTSAVRVDAPITFNSTMTASQEATFAERANFGKDIAVTGAVTALKYSAKVGAWEGVGAFANQYTNAVAPFFSPKGYSAPAKTSSYAPLIKGAIQTAGLGYATAFSFGALTSGNSEFPKICISATHDSGTVNNWTFDTNNGSFNSGGIIYEAGQRVYGPNNKPSSTDVNAISRDSCHVAGFVSGNANDPYMRHTASNAVVILPTRTQLSDEITSVRNWANKDLRNDIYAYGDNRYVYDVQRGSQALENGSFVAQADWEAPTGCFMTGIKNRVDLGDARTMGKYYRALMVRTASGGWRQVGN